MDEKSATFPLLHLIWNMPPVYGIYEIGLINKLERVQHRLEWFVMGRYDYYISVSSKSNELKSESLSDCRLKFSLLLLNKFQDNIFSDSVKNILRTPTYYDRLDHNHKIREIDCRTDRF